MPQVDRATLVLRRWRKDWNKTSSRTQWIIFGIVGHDLPSG